MTPSMQQRNWGKIQPSAHPISLFNLRIRPAKHALRPIVTTPLSFFEHTLTRNLRRFFSSALLSHLNSRLRLVPLPHPQSLLFARNPNHFRSLCKVPSQGREHSENCRHCMRYSRLQEPLCCPLLLRHAKCGEKIPLLI